MDKYTIISVDTNPLYLEFLPLFYKIWNKFKYKVVLILTLKQTEQFKDYSFTEKYSDIFYVIQKNNELNFMTDRAFSLMARHLYYQYLPKGKYMLNDIDMIPLNKKYFDDLFLLDDNKLISASSDAMKYNKDSDGGKIYKMPSCYLIANNNIWKDITNPWNLEPIDLLKKYNKLSVIFHNKEKFNSFNFCDESFMRKLLYLWDNNYLDNIIKLNRKFNPYAENRVDRGNWKIDFKKLQNNEYIDSHLPRPLFNNIIKINPLLNYLNINYNDLKI
jgi:hypothetical protein